MSDDSDAVVYAEKQRADQLAAYSSVLEEQLAELVVLIAESEVPPEHEEALAATS